MAPLFLLGFIVANAAQVGSAMLSVTGTLLPPPTIDLSSKIWFVHIHKAAGTSFIAFLNEVIAKPCEDYRVCCSLKAINSQELQKTQQWWSAASTPRCTFRTTEDNLPNLMRYIHGSNAMRVPLMGSVNSPQILIMYRHPVGRCRSHWAFINSLCSRLQKHHNGTESEPCKAVREKYSDDRRGHEKFVEDKCSNYLSARVSFRRHLGVSGPHATYEWIVKNVHFWGIGDDRELYDASICLLLFQTTNMAHADTQSRCASGGNPYRDRPILNAASNRVVPRMELSLTDQELGDKSGLDLQLYSLLRAGFVKRVLFMQAQTSMRLLHNAAAANTTTLLPMTMAAGRSGHHPKRARTTRNETETSLNLNLVYVVLEDFSALASPVFSPSVKSLDKSTTWSSHHYTPHLAKLAARGSVFTRAFCQVPICNPSRASFLTGRRPAATHVYSNDDPATTPHLPTLVDYLREAHPSAVLLCAGGKVFHRPCGKKRDHHGFQVFNYRNSSDKERATMARNQKYLRNALPSDNAFDAVGAAAGGRGQQTYAALRRVLKTASSRRTVDQHVAYRAAVQLAGLARTRRKFFLALGFASTHAWPTAHAGGGTRSCKPDAAAAEKFGSRDEQGSRWSDSFELALPRNLSDLKDPPLLSWKNYDLPLKEISTAQERNWVDEYFLCAQHVDAQMGALLDALDLLHLRQNTVVVVQGDHGYSLGRHGRWSKYSLYEDALRVPLLVAHPDQRNAVVMDHVVESIDVLPTILALWGSGGRGQKPSTSLPREIEGRSLHRYLANEVVAHSSRATATAAADGDELRRAYARSEYHGQMQLNDPSSAVPGVRTAPPFAARKVSAFSIRSRDYAYVAYVAVGCGCHGLELRDEALFDLRRDAGEATNLAYEPAASAVRRSMLAAVRSEWNLTSVRTGTAFLLEEGENGGEPVVAAEAVRRVREEAIKKPCNDATAPSCGPGGVLRDARVWLGWPMSS